MPKIPMPKAFYNNSINPTLCSSLTNNNDIAQSWDGKLGRKDKFPDRHQIRIIYKLNRDDIFKHKYTVQNLFDHMYKNSADKAKRQPNPFMIFRAVLGKVAVEKDIKIGDGTLQSKLAGFIWAGASTEEKKEFENLAADFKIFHKVRFPTYEYKPKARSPTVGAVFETKTAEDYEQLNQQPNLDYDTYSILNSLDQNTFDNYSAQKDYPQNEQSEILFTSPSQIDQFSFLNGNQFLNNQILTNTLEQYDNYQDFLFEGYPSRQQQIPAELFLGNFSEDTLEKSGNYLSNSTIAPNCYPHDQSQNQNQNQSIFQIPTQIPITYYNIFDPNPTTFGGF